MGQPALELPDPSESSLRDDKPSADDLLSQMAGDEIDRLLKESETARPGAPLPSNNAGNHQDDRRNSAAAQDESRAGPLAAEEGPHPETGPGGATQAAGSPGQTKSTATSPLSSPEGAGAAASSGLISDDEFEASIAAVVTADFQADVDREIANADSVESVDNCAAERTALGGAIDEALRASIQVDGQESTERASVFWVALKPLEWINAPVASWSDRARDLIGKVALLTLFNAAAILVYALLFRRH